MLTQALHGLEFGAVIQGVLRLTVLMSLVLGATRLARTIYLTRRQPKHLLRLGLLNSSHLADQYDARYDKAEEDSRSEASTLR